MTQRTPLSGPSVWTGADIKDSKRWIREFPTSGIAALEDALAEQCAGLIAGGADVYVRRWQNYAKNLKRIG